VYLLDQEFAVCVATRQVIDFGYPLSICDHQLEFSLIIVICMYAGNGCSQRELLSYADAGM
ncbi:hypothetical protein RA276_29475, partial [Pseudomonas syringae pv. tagetis]|uniref:hypothetical protein n=1 Tax=Pseudomonas syringae group genomosp. 7 TaxID=251699 RepID=UPI0037707358